MTYLYILSDLATLIDIHESSSVLLIENCNGLWSQRMGMVVVGGGAWSNFVSLYKRLNVLYARLYIQNVILILIMGGHK